MIRADQLPDVERVLAWLEELRRSCPMETEIIPIDQMKRWERDARLSGGYCHETGEFYSVVGIRTTGACEREVSGWDQPMLWQREMGILGLLMRADDASGKNVFLLQAKAEPGNVHKLQLSPTLQSTISNLKRAHGGTKSLFAHYFEDPAGNGCRVLYDQNHCEDGGRLYQKYNRHMIVELSEDHQDLKIPGNFIWLSLWEIKALLWRDNVVNCSVRSIIAAI